MSATIFSPVCDNRPRARRIACLAASLVVNALSIGGCLLAFQVSAAHRSAERLAADLRRMLAMNRVIMILPSPLQPVAVRDSKSAPARTEPSRRPALPPPLAVPNPRLLERFDPQLAGFIRDNPKIESIFTREIVRDVDSRLLDVSKLLAKSNLEIRFEIDPEGHIRRPRIRKSSTVPSIDHLAVETVLLLEKYRLAEAFREAAQVLASISISEQVEVRIEAIMRKHGTAAAAKKRLQAAFALMRFAMRKEEADYFMQDIAIRESADRLTLSKEFAKDSLIEFLKHYDKSRTPE